MAELFYLLGLISPFLMMWWMIRASRRARQRAAERGRENKPPPFSSHAFEEQTEGADGLHYGRSYDGDDVTIPPNADSGEPAGIKALQGRR